MYHNVGYIIVDYKVVVRLLHQTMPEILGSSYSIHPTVKQVLYKKLISAIVVVN